MMGSDVNIKLE